MSNITEEEDYALIISELDGTGFDKDDMNYDKFTYLDWYLERYGVSEVEAFMVSMYIQIEEINIDLYLLEAEKEFRESCYGTKEQLAEFRSEVEKVGKHINNAIEKVSKYEMQLDTVYAYLSFNLPKIWKAYAFRSTTPINHNHIPISFASWVRNENVSGKEIDNLSVIRMEKKKVKGAYLPFHWNSDESEYLIQTGLVLKMIDMYRQHTGRPILVFTDDVSEDEETCANGPLIIDFKETPEMIGFIEIEDDEAVKLSKTITLEKLLATNIFGRPTFMYPVLRRKESIVHKIYKNIFERFPYHINTFMNYRSGSGDTLISTALTNGWFEPAKSEKRSVPILFSTTKIETPHNIEIVPLLNHGVWPIDLPIPNWKDKYGRNWLFYVRDISKYINQMVQVFKDTSNDMYDNSVILYRFLIAAMFRKVYWMPKLINTHFYRILDAYTPNKFGQTPITWFDSTYYPDYVIANTNSDEVLNFKDINEKDVEHRVYELDRKYRYGY